MYLTARLNKPLIRAKAVLCVVFAIALIGAPKIAVEGISGGLRLCYGALIPSLFPFLFIVDYLCCMISAAGSKKKWTGIAAAVVFGIVGGYPMGAKALGDVCLRGEISAKKAAALLCGCVNAGPAYLISAVGLGLFGSFRAGMILFAAVTAASLVCLILGLILVKDTDRPASTPTARDIVRVQASFMKSMSYALNATLSLCAYVTFFSCIGAYANRALLLFSDSKIIAWAVGCILEVCIGSAAAAHIGSVRGLVLAAVSASVCGTSVILQLMSFTSSAKISLKYFLLSRPVHAAVSAGFIYILVPLFPSLSDVFASRAVHKLYSLSPLFSVFFMMTAAIFVFSDKKKIVDSGQ